MPFPIVAAASALPSIIGLFGSLFGGKKKETQYSGGLSPQDQAYRGWIQDQTKGLASSYRQNVPQIPKSYLNAQALLYKKFGLGTPPTYTSKSYGASPQQQQQRWTPNYRSYSGGGMGGPGMWGGGQGGRGSMADLMGPQGMGGYQRSYAGGGIAAYPQTARLGERGPEAIIPLGSYGQQRRGAQTSNPWGSTGGGLSPVSGGGLGAQRYMPTTTGPVYNPDLTGGGGQGGGLSPAGLGFGGGGGGQVGLANPALYPRGGQGGGGLAPAGFGPRVGGGQMGAQPLATGGQMGAETSGYLQPPGMSQSLGRQGGGQGGEMLQALMQQARARQQAQAGGGLGSRSYMPTTPGNVYNPDLTGLAGLTGAMSGGLPGSTQLTAPGGGNYGMTSTPYAQSSPYARQFPGGFGGGNRVNPWTRQQRQW